MNRRVVAMVALLSAASVQAACTGPRIDDNASADVIATGDTVPVAGPLWTATDLYLTPAEPSALPQTVAGTVTIVFGESSAVGSTGCAQFQADVTFFNDRDLVGPDDADQLTIDALEITNVDDSCTDAARAVHEEITRLISLDARLLLSRRGPTELVLTSTDSQFDAPSLRLAAV